MATRTARTAWTGTLQEGSGHVELTSSQLATYEVSFPRRTAEQAEGTTSPEELIAAAHSSCYAMQLSALVAGPDPAGGLHLTGITLTVRGEVEGLDADGFRKAAEEARVGCPVSKALTGVEITVDAALKG